MARSWVESRVAWIGCLALAPILLLRLTSRSDPLHAFPRLMLWAWESPQDLRFLQPGRAGIAFLARTVWLDGERVGSRPRLQPLRYTPGTALMAVVRFESAGNGLPAVADVVAEVMPAAEISGVRALQIDFDARSSERRWYAEFLRGLRAALPAKLPLTITALESWCDRDRWLDGLPVDEATPMLFRMGFGERVPSDFSSSVCRFSIGVSTDEPLRRAPRGRRVYYFHPGPWTESAYREVLAQVSRSSR